MRERRGCSGEHATVLAEGWPPAPLPGRPRRLFPAAAAPSLLRCTLTAKKVGLKAYGTSAPRLEGCRLETCGEQGLRAHEAAAAALHG